MVNKIIDMLKTEDVEMRNLGILAAGEIFEEDKLNELYIFLKEMPEKDQILYDLLSTIGNKLHVLRERGGLPN